MMCSSASACSQHSGLNIWSTLSQTEWNIDTTWLSLPVSCLHPVRHPGLCLCSPGGALWKAASPWNSDYLRVEPEKSDCWDGVSTSFVRPKNLPAPTNKIWAVVCDCWNILRSEDMLSCSKVQHMFEICQWIAWIDETTIKYNKV